MQDDATQEERTGFYRSLIDAMPHIVFVHDGTRNLYANLKWLEYTGHTASDRSSWEATIHPDEVEQVLHQWRESIARYTPYETEVRLRRADGVYRRHLLRIIPTLDEHGRVRRWIGTATDIEDRVPPDVPERALVEEEIHKNERRWHRLVESKLFGVVITNEQRVLDANQVYLDIIGYTAEELREGKILRANLTPAEYKPLDDRGLQELQATGSSMPYEKEYVRRDGTRVPVLLGSTTLTEEPLSWIGFVVDLSEQRRIAKSLRENEEQLRALTKASPVFLFTMSATGECLYASDYYYEFTGRPPGAFNGDGWLAAHHPDDRARTVERRRRTLVTGDPFENEYRLRRADGIYRWFKANAVPVRDETGGIAGWYGGSIDIHDQKEVQDALIEADRRKNEFLAMLAHELRNPLAPIVNALAILERTSLPEPRLNAACTIIDRQVRHLTRIVDDLLDVTRITTGKIQLRKESVTVASIVAQGIESARPLLDERNHRLEVSLPESPVIIEGDVVRLTQVLLNLLNNAAKYTGEGGAISLRVERGNNEAVIRVRDNGYGIAPNVLPHVFDLFVQADSTPGRSLGGLGIGLTIVRRLTELHGGRVEAHSEGVGRGSEFIVRLPINEGQQPQHIMSKNGIAPTSVHPDRRRVLVIDDNTDHVETLSTLLEMSGFVVATAANGRSALEAVLTFKPQVILLDIGLPDLDGYKVGEQIRQATGGSGITMIAVTGYDRADDRARSKSAGFDHHLVKPVDFDRLVSILSAEAPIPAVSTT